MSLPSKYQAVPFGPDEYGVIALTGEERRNPNRAPTFDLTDRHVIPGPLRSKREAERLAYEFSLAYEAGRLDERKGND